MTKNKPIWYFCIFVFCFFVDRISKFFAIKLLQNDLVVNKNINFSLIWNRGISWGLLNFESNVAFWLLTFFIFGVIIIFFVYTFIQYKNNFDITFETLVLSGAGSNIIDRVIYGAVVDFIEFHVHDWYWPTFNIADAFVVVGIVGILIRSVFIGYVCKN
jgi:signal peptidase II